MENKLFLIVNPDIARMFPDKKGSPGILESVLLERIYYWMQLKCAEPDKYKNSFVDGHCWVYNTMDEWTEQMQGMWNKRTIQRAFHTLKESKAIIVGNYNKLKADRTCWYTINFEIVDESLFVAKHDINISKTTMTTCHCGEGRDVIHNNDMMSSAIPNNTIPYTSPKKSSIGVQGRVPEKPKHNAGDIPFDFMVVERQFRKACKELEAENVDDVLYVVKKFYQCWFRNFGWSGEPPRRLSQREVEQCVRSMWEYEDDSGCIEYIELWEYDDLIEKYFEIDFPDCDYSLTHFLSGKIRKYRLYETAL